MIWNAIPYCGTPPVPGGATWNLDPILFGLLALGALAYSIGYRRQDALRRSGPPIATPRQAALFGAGWLVLTLALMSPLCNLSVALFTARIGQHMIMALIAAPLIVAGRADIMLARALGSFDDRPGLAGFVLGAIGFAVAVWFWHMPAPYDLTFKSDLIYWSMHATMFGTALLLWRVILRSELGGMLLASFITGIQMCGIGAVLTLAPAALFAVHFDTSWAWGLSPLQDQTLGGLIMWVPGGLILTLEVLAALGIYLHRLDERDRQQALSA